MTLGDLVQVVEANSDRALAARIVGRTLDGENFEGLQGVTWERRGDKGNVLIVDGVEALAYAGYGSTMGTQSANSADAQREQRENTLRIESAAYGALLRKRGSLAQMRLDMRTVVDKEEQRGAAIVFALVFLLEQMHDALGTDDYELVDSHAPNSANEYSEFGWHIDDHAAQEGGPELEYTVVSQCSEGTASMRVAGVEEELVYPGQGGSVVFPAWAYHRTGDVEPAQEGGSMWKLAGFFKKKDRVSAKLEATARAYCLTLGDGGENEIGMEIIGSTAAAGVSVQQLREIQQSLGTVKCELVDLVPLAGTASVPEAAVLVLRGGVDALLHTSPYGAAAVLDELDRMPKDTEGLTRGGKVHKKHARHNNTMADYSQQPDIANKKGTVVCFADYPATNALRGKVRSLLGDTGVEWPSSTETKTPVGELNDYHDAEKCGIGFHGDKERRIVVGVRMGPGADGLPLKYLWWHKHKPVGSEGVIDLNAGDMYIMSAKAVGTDYDKPSIYTLRHAAGREGYTFAQMANHNAVKKRGAQVPPVLRWQDGGWCARGGVTSLEAMGIDTLDVAGLSRKKHARVDETRKKGSKAKSPAPKRLKKAATQKKAAAAAAKRKQPDSSEGGDEEEEQEEQHVAWEGTFMQTLGSGEMQTVPLEGAPASVREMVAALKQESDCQAIMLLAGTPSWYRAMGVPEAASNSRAAKIVRSLLESDVPPEQRRTLERIYVRHEGGQYPFWALTADGLQSLAAAAKATTIAELNTAWRRQEEGARKTKAHEKAMKELQEQGHVCCPTCALPFVDSSDPQYQLKMQQIAQLTTPGFVMQRCSCRGNHGC